MTDFISQKNIDVLQRVCDLMLDGTFSIANLPEEPYYDKSLHEFDYDDSYNTAEWLRAFLDDQQEELGIDGIIKIEEEQHE